ELNNNTRFKPSVQGGPRVIVDTRGPRMYDFDDLKKPHMVDGELSLGVVSFKAVVILRGAGANQTEGVNSIKLGWVQDVESTTLIVRYVHGSADLEPRPRTGPWLDSARDKDPPGLPPNRIGTGGDT